MRPAPARGRTELDDRGQRRGMMLAVVRFASLLLCAVVAGLTGDNLQYLEYGGGAVSGVLVRLCLAGSITLLGAAVLTFVWPRIAAAIGVLGAVLCLPLYTGLIVPSSLRWVSSLPSSHPVPTGLVADEWAIAGLGAILLAALVHGVALRPQSTRASTM